MAMIAKSDTKDQIQKVDSFRHALLSFGFFFFFFNVFCLVYSNFFTINLEVNGHSIRSPQVLFQRNSNSTYKPQSMVLFPFLCKPDFLLDGAIH